MIRPWHKSPLFYLGLAPLLFILWAWADGHSYDSTLVARRQAGAMEHRVWIGNYSGTVTFVIERYLADPFSPPQPRFGLEREPAATSELDWFTGPDFYTNDERDIPSGKLYLGSAAHIPHWLILLAYLTLWSLLLLWRSRRRKRLSCLKISA